MDFGFIVISSVFYVVLYGPRCWVNKGPLSNLDTVLLFVSQSVVFERLLEGPLISFLLFVFLVVFFLCCLSISSLCVTSFVQALLGRGLEGFV